MRRSAFTARELIIFKHSPTRHSAISPSASANRLTTLFGASLHQNQLTWLQGVLGKGIHKTVDVSDELSERDKWSRACRPSLGFVMQQQEMEVPSMDENKLKAQSDKSEVWVPVVLVPSSSARVFSPDIVERWPKLLKCSLSVKNYLE